MTREMIIEQLERHRQEFALDHGWNTSVLESLDAAIKVLKQEPCEDAISRQAVVDSVNKALSEYMGESLLTYSSLILDYIKALPSVQPKPKMGRWIESHIPESTLCECSVCGFSCGAYSFNFCPNCGAKMESEETK